MEVCSYLPWLTWQQALRLTANQNVFLLDLLEGLGEDYLVKYILAECPDVVWEADICDCVIDCGNSQQLILKIIFFLHGRWQVAGPVARNKTIIVSPNASITSDILYVANLYQPSHQQSGIRPLKKSKILFHHRMGGD